MYRAHFAVRMHEEYGSLGFQDLARPWAEPLQGMTIAHDLLEHFPGDTGTMEEEMMAFGSTMLVRGEAYYYGTGSRYTMAENMASDFPMFDGYYQNDGRSGRLRSPGRTTRIDDIEDHITEMIAKARKLFWQEEDRAPPVWLCDEDIRGWIRIGHRKAIRRYNELLKRGGSPLQLFYNIRDSIDRELKHAEEGYEFEFKLLLPNERFSLEEYYPDEPY